MAQSRSVISRAQPRGRGTLEAMRRMHIVIGCLLLGSVAMPAFAQIGSDIDTTQLQYDEAQLLKKGPNAAVYMRRIADDRVRIRSQLTKDINDLLLPLQKEQDSQPAKAIDQQRQIVDDLTGRSNESAVDLNLLKDEERVYTGAVSGSGRFMITKSYPELLAKKVVLEEQVDLLSTALTAQQKRLSKLLSEERSTNIGVFVTILTYLLVVFLVLYVEHFIRTSLLVRIPHRGFRYTVTKIFTVVVYLSLLFWLAQRIYAEYPGFVTVFAVIGAAMIFMLQDGIKSLLGWFTYRGSLALGQRVTLGGYTGDVLDISILFTSILVSRSPGMEDSTQAGKIVRVPNSTLLSGSFINFNSTSDFENVEVPICIADPKQWARAYDILDEILQDEAAGYSKEAQRQMDKRMRGYYASQVSPSTRVYLEFTEKHQLCLLLCFPAPIGHRRAITTSIIRLVLERFEAESIRLADPV